MMREVENRFALMRGRFWLFPQVRASAGLLSHGRSQGFKSPHLHLEGLVAWVFWPYRGAGFEPATFGL